jgi:aspartate--ammonia ligase
MRAVRKDYFLDHDHSAYVDQWDWERVITAEQRNLDFLKGDGQQDLEGDGGRGEVRAGAVPAIQRLALSQSAGEVDLPACRRILDMYPDLPRKQRETAMLQKYPAVFIIGIGWPLKDGYPHEMRAADYDDWVTETRSDQTGKDGTD